MKTKKMEKQMKKITKDLKTCGKDVKEIVSMLVEQVKEKNEQTEEFTDELEFFNDYQMRVRIHAMHNAELYAFFNELPTEDKVKILKVILNGSKKDVALMQSVYDAVGPTAKKSLRTVILSDVQKQSASVALTK